MLTRMLAKLRSCLVPAASVCIGVGVTIGDAPAVTVEVAKKCAALTAKAFPPRVVGNPAAGFVTRTGQSQQMLVVTMRPTVSALRCFHARSSGLRSGE